MNQSKAPETDSPLLDTELLRRSLPASRPARVPPRLDILARFGTCITEAALRGEIIAVVGREREIKALGRAVRKDSCPHGLLIGPPGTGKTSVVEGFALHLVKGESVPPSLRHAWVYSVSLGALQAGASNVGIFEERLLGIVEECEKSGQRIILFFDEFHQVKGAGVFKNHDCGAADLLKPMLGRPGTRVSVIGATTSAEYPLISADSAFDRRFEKIIIRPMSDEQCTAVLASRKSRLETHSGVKIPDRLLAHVVQMAGRYSRDEKPSCAVKLLENALTVAEEDGSSCLNEANILECLAVDTPAAGIPVPRRLATFERGLRSEGFAQNVRENLQNAVLGILGRANGSQGALILAGGRASGRELAAKHLSECIYGNPPFSLSLAGPEAGQRIFGDGAHSLKAHFLESNAASFVILNDWCLADPVIQNHFLVAIRDGQLGSLPCRNVVFVIMADWYAPGVEGGDIERTLLINLAAKQMLKRSLGPVVDHADAIVNFGTASIDTRMATRRSLCRAVKKLHALGVRVKIDTSVRSLLEKHSALDREGIDHLVEQLILNPISTAAWRVGGLQACAAVRVEIVNGQITTQIQVRQ